MIYLQKSICIRGSIKGAHRSLTNMTVAFDYMDEDMLKVNSVHNMTKTGVCRSGVVTK